MLNIWRWWQVDPFLGWMHYIGTKKSRVCSWAARKSCLWYVSRGMRETVIIFLWVTKPAKYQCNTKNPLPFFLAEQHDSWGRSLMLQFSSHTYVLYFSDHSVFHGWVTIPISEVLIEHMVYKRMVHFFYSSSNLPMAMELPTQTDLFNFLFFLFTSLEKLWFRNDIKVDVPATIMDYLENDTGII
jgi:hypothetical protein